MSLFIPNLEFIWMVLLWLNTMLDIPNRKSYAIELSPIIHKIGKRHLMAKRVSNGDYSVATYTTKRWSTIRLLCLQPGDHRWTPTGHRRPPGTGSGRGRRSHPASELYPEPDQVTMWVRRVFRHHKRKRRGEYARMRDPRQRSSNSSWTSPGLRLEKVIRTL